MIVYCTGKLKEELKIVSDTSEVIDPFFSWHGTLVKVNFKKTLIMINESNRFVLIFYDIKIKDYPYLPDLIKRGIKEAMLDQMVNPEMVETYLETAGVIRFFGKSEDNLTGRLNTAISEVELLELLFKKHSMYQSYITRLVNESPRELKRDIYTTPYELLYRDFAQFGYKDIVHTHAVHLRIELDMSKKDMWFEIIIPDNFYFDNLHRIIHLIFDLDEDNLHDFHIYSSEGTEVLNIVCDDELLAYEIDAPLSLEWEVKLKDCIPKYPLIKYLFDFDNTYYHSIIFIKKIFNYNTPYPVCLGGVRKEPIDFEKITKIIKYMR